jgi:hypothetical protein
MAANRQAFAEQQHERYEAMSHAGFSSAGHSVVSEAPASTVQYDEDGLPRPKPGAFAQITVGGTARHDVGYDTLTQHKGSALAALFSAPYPLLAHHAAGRSAHGMHYIPPAVCTAAAFSAVLEYLRSGGEWLPHRSEAAAEETLTAARLFGLPSLPPAPTFAADEEARCSAAHELAVLEVPLDEAGDGALPASVADMGQRGYRVLGHLVSGPHELLQSDADKADLRRSVSAAAEADARSKSIGSTVVLSIAEEMATDEPLDLGPLNGTAVLMQRATVPVAAVKEVRGWGPSDGQPSWLDTIAR